MYELQYYIYNNSYFIFSMITTYLIRSFVHCVWVKTNNSIIALISNEHYRSYLCCYSNNTNSLVALSAHYLQLKPSYFVHFIWAYHYVQVVVCRYPVPFMSTSEHSIATRQLWIRDQKILKMTIWRNVSLMPMIKIEESKMK